MQTKIKKNMQRKDAKEYLENLVDTYRRMDEQWDKLSELTGFQCDAPFGQTYWATLSILIDAYSTILGDQSESLDWFVWDNDCGKKGLDHSLPDDTIISVKDIETFLDVLGFQNE